MTAVTLTLNEDGTFSDGKNELTLRAVIKLARERRDANRAEAKAARDRIKAAKAGQKKAKLLARKEKLEAELAKLA
jgi:hypothetical protein